MSGGVDSGVAAALLIKEGFEVMGMTLRLHACEETLGGRSCCGSDAVAEAAAVAGLLGISHYVLDCHESFERLVLHPSWLEYTKGRTPNPCVLCNERIKFGLLLDRARTLGAEKIATGHYARIGTGRTGSPVLMRSVDRRKDQTYFLFALNAGMLSAALFPVGGHTKEEVREMARKMGLRNVDREESQDACFKERGIPWPEVLRRRFKETARPGRIFDELGRDLGKHGGIHLFTVGQRRGLGIPLGRPAWVQSVDPENAAVVLTTRRDGLLSEGLTAKGVLWWGATARKHRAIHCSAQVRYNQEPVPAIVECDGPERALVRFQQPVMAVTPGQAVVFYRGPVVLGGGWIEHALHSGNIDQ